MGSNNSASALLYFSPPLKPDLTALLTAFLIVLSAIAGVYALPAASKPDSKLSNAISIADSNFIGCNLPSGTFFDTGVDHLRQGAKALFTFFQFTSSSGYDKYSDFQYFPASSNICLDVF